MVGPGTEDTEDAAGLKLRLGEDTRGLKLRLGVEGNVSGITIVCGAVKKVGSAAATVNAGTSVDARVVAGTGTVYTGACITCWMVSTMGFAEATMVRNVGAAGDATTGVAITVWAEGVVTTGLVNTVGAAGVVATGVETTGAVKKAGTAGVVTMAGAATC
jgi:hypothetical protein